MYRLNGKPILPQDRGNDHFQIGDGAMIWLRGWRESGGKVFYPKDWIDGVVADGPEQGEGGVSVCASKKIHSGQYLEGFGVGVKVTTPEVLRKDEWIYLITHPDFAEEWAAGAFAEDLVPKFLESLEQARS